MKFVELAFSGHEGPRRRLPHEPTDDAGHVAIDATVGHGRPRTATRTPTSGGPAAAADAPAQQG